MLDGVGARLSREQLLESLLDPNATLAEGYGGAISPMPPMGGILPYDDLRDLVAFLAELNAESGR